MNQNIDFSHICKFSDVIQQDISNKKVFIRSDLNVPLDAHGNITDDTRIKASIPAILMALKANTAVMVTSHLGRPTEGQPNKIDSLAPVAKRLSELLGQEVILVQNWLEHKFDVQPNQVVLLENCRLNIGEENNSKELSQKMANLCDIFVHDAFGTAHRAQASTNGIAKFVKIACAGPLLTAELEALNKALYKPLPPVIAIVGGSKVSTKLEILASLADKVDALIVGGGIANTFMLASGLKIGKSLAEPSLVEQAKNIMKKMQSRGANIPIPSDVITAKQISPNEIAVIKSIEQIEDDDLILDIGPNTANNLAKQLENAGTIIWNGPVGVFELENFSNGTRILGQAIASSKAFSIAGGGDTLAAINKFNLNKQISYISTGGGAFLEFLEGKHLPIFDVLINK